MAWTPAQEKLIGEIMTAEIIKRLETNQANAVAMIFDPNLPNAARTLLRNRLNTLKTETQTNLAAVATRAAESTAHYNAQITLIDSILVQIP